MIINNELAIEIREWADKYETADFISSDPVQFPRRYSGRDAEVSGFITSWLSFGNRKAIIGAAERMDREFGGSPYGWLMDRQYVKYKGNMKKVYRFLSYYDLYNFCSRLKSLYMGFETMEDMVLTSPKRPPVTKLAYLFSGINGIPVCVEGGLACKRLSMFLRWMVRKDSPVDLGIWQRVDPKDLIIPLDVHVHNVALELGLTSRKRVDMKAAMEVTEAMRQIFPDDPARGDFALFGYGIEKIKD
jgi:uncharacterized protein (TIGR02757 family)